MQRIPNPFLAGPKCDVFAFLMAAMFIFVGCSGKLATQLHCPQNMPPLVLEKTVCFEKSGIPCIEVALAQDADSRADGLMCRDSLAENSGMLFIYHDAAQRTFWMRKTRMSLDIIFIGSDQRVVHIAESCEPYAFKNIASNGMAQYVLETHAGFCQQFGLSEGDALIWPEGLDYRKEDISY